MLKKGLLIYLAMEEFYIKVNKSNPQKVLSISTQSEDNDFPFKFMLVGVMIFLLFLFASEK